MSARDVALDHHADRQTLVLAGAEVAGQLWASVDPSNVVTSWMVQVPELTVVTSGAQLAAAKTADSYLDEVSDAQDIDPVSEFDVDPSAFTGTASDGRSLVGLLTSPAFAVLQAIAAGSSPRSAVDLGGQHLDTIVRTQIADAGRAADQVALTARKEISGYIRIAVGRTCSRCVILAGRFYAYSAGFQRHPRCDCVHLPSTIAKAAGFRQNPRAIYDSLTAQERSRAGWSLADQRAMAEGADLNQVTNVRGVTSAGGQRSFGRLTPDEIYARAGSRDEAIRLLRDNGYLRTGATPVPRVAVEAPALPAKPAVKPVSVARTEVSRVELSGGMLAKVEKVEYSDGVTVVQKTAKTVEGLRPRHQQDAEELGALVLRAVGLRAPEVRRLAAAKIEMELIEGRVAATMRARSYAAATREESDRFLDEYLSLVHSDQGRRMGLADILMDNYDRNPGNWILTADGEMVGIDHGLSWQRLDKFNEGPSVQRGADYWHTEPAGHYVGRAFGTPGHGQWAPNDLTLDDVRRVRTRLREIRSEFERLGRQDWYEYMQARLDIIETHARGTRNRIAGV